MVVMDDKQDENVAKFCKNSILTAFNMMQVKQIRYWASKLFILGAFVLNYIEKIHFCKFSQFLKKLNLTFVTKYN